MHACTNVWECMQCEPLCTVPENGIENVNYHMAEWGELQFHSTAYAIPMLESRISSLDSVAKEYIPFMLHMAKMDRCCLSFNMSQRR